MRCAALLQNIKRTALAAAVSASVAGCAIYPVTEQSTGLDTYTIVQQVRCETRDAIRFYIKRLLVRHDQPDLADRLEKRSLPYKDLLKEKLHPVVRGGIEYYGSSEIAYEFTFDITENNATAANATLSRPFVRRTDKIGLSASSDLLRENLRNFRIFDRFGDLALQTDEVFCQARPLAPNPVYPIAGQIGVVNLVGTFLDLNQSGNLYGSKDKPTIPVISDTISFTTKLSGTVNPTVSISPLGPTFQLAEAGLKLDAYRQDRHQVIVVIALPPSKGPTTVVAREQRVATVSELERQRQIANDVAITSIGRNIQTLVR